MFHCCNTQPARAALGAALLTLFAACSDGPSGLRQPLPPDRTSRIADDRDAVETVTIRSRVDGMQGEKSSAREQEWSTSARGGIAMVELTRLGVAPDGAIAPVALRVWERGSRQVPGVRRPRTSMRLADGRVAIIEREFSKDGVPTSMSARVGDDEFRWERAWVRSGDRFALAGAVFESRHRGVVVSRTSLNLKTRSYSAAGAGAPQVTLRGLLAISRRFGAVAGTVLLPRALKAQSDGGKACNGSSTALSGAWMAWRVATVTWFTSMAFGSPSAILKSTTAMFAASATVEVAEANYIDCYVAATRAGVPDGSIAQPPVEDEL